MSKAFAPPLPTNDDIARICVDALGTSPTAITEIRSGAWSSAVALETAQGEMIMRFSAIPDDFHADQLASRFAGPELPVPQVYSLGQHGERWWCISQRMPGVHLDDLSAEDMQAVIPSLAAMLRAMRDVPATGTYGYGGWDADGNGLYESFAAYLLDIDRDTPGERGSGWSAKLALHTRAQRTFNNAMDKLRRYIRYVPDDSHLVHSDTLNFNVTVTGTRISGIFDWGCALWGDALYDLAWFDFCTWWYPQWSQLNITAALQHLVGMEGENTAERLRCYKLHIGLGSIRYNALIGNVAVMNDAVAATEKVLRELP